ncbi:MAG: hypothetical protein ABJF01_09500 [bacterium]
MAQHRQIASPTYLVALTFVLIPPFDALMQLLPLRIHDPRWRFGFFGLMANALMLPMIGLLIAFMASAYFEHKAFQRVLGILSAVVAVGIVAVLGLFALDAVQLRPDVKPVAQLAFKVASLTAAFKYLLGLITLSTFALASLRAPRLPRTARNKRANNLVMGTTATGARPSGALASPEPESSAT